MERLAQAGLVRGKTVGVDGTTAEANAALRVRAAVRTPPGLVSPIACPQAA